MIGKFIVLDGTDGSGKKTQADLLVKKFKNENRPVFYLDFPQYGKKSAGPVEEYLNGKYGGLNDVTPYQASILYAVDRFDIGFEIKKQLTAGATIIANRYVSANMGHQGAKIPDAKTRNKFFNWLYDLEYNIFAIPRPDINLILHVQAEIAQQLVDRKTAREYIAGKKRDIHENDLNHLKKAEAVYLEMAETLPDFTLIECARDNQIMSVEEIHELIWKEVLKIIE